MSKRIAPTLTRLVLRDYQGPYLFDGDAEEQPIAVTELRALLAVARAAERVNAGIPARERVWGNRLRLDRALARLARVSGDSEGGTKR